MNSIFTIGLLIPCLLGLMQEKEMNVTLYDIKDQRFEKVLNEVLAEADSHADEMQYRDQFSIMFDPPYTDTVVCVEVDPETSDISSEEKIHVEKIDYGRVLIYCTHEICAGEGDGHVVYKGTDFILSNPVDTAILRKTDRKRAFGIAEKVKFLDDYYVWEYRYEPVSGFKLLHSPFKQMNPDQ